MTLKKIFIIGTIWRVFIKRTCTEHEREKIKKEKSRVK